MIDLSAEDGLRLARLLADLRHRKETRLFDKLYPDATTEWPDGTVFHARHLYAKHLEHFEAGAKYRQRCVLAANRTGKTLSGAYEVAVHATGRYPHWWKGRRFERPVRIWAAGKTNETTRDILQTNLFGAISHSSGKKGFDGLGVVPHDTLGRPTWKQGVADLADVVPVRHVSGGFSLVGLKSYQQGRGSFEGTAQHVCLAAGQLVQMGDGRVKAIEEVRPGEFVLSVDQRGEPVNRRVTAVHDNGERDCIRVMPKQGSPTICTPDHNLFWGYRAASKAPAAEAARVAQIVPGSFWPEVTEDRSEAAYIWGGLVVSDGTIRSRKVTNGNVVAMEEAIASLPPEARVRRKDFSGGHVPDWHLYWSAFWDDIAPAVASEKHIPDWVWTSSKARARLFVRWLFGGDGWANGKTIGYATTSERLASEVVVLLNRLGIRASVYRKAAQKDNWSDQFWVQITRGSEALKFCDEIGIAGKDEAVAKVRAEAARRVLSKIERCQHLAREEVKHDRDWIRERMDRQRLKESKIRKREDVGTRRVYDLSVEGEHRFLSGTNLVSNCWLDEEPPRDVYGECLIRTATTNGIVILTFTPLEGMSETVLEFMPQESRPDAG